MEIRKYVEKASNRLVGLGIGAAGIGIVTSSSLFTALGGDLLVGGVLGKVGLGFTKEK